MCDYDNNGAVSWCELGWCEWEFSQESGCVPACGCFDEMAGETTASSDSGDKCWMFNEPCDTEVELDVYCSCFDYNNNVFYACSNDKCNWNYEMMFWHMAMTD